MANFFVFILGLIGAQSCYFGRRWKWFFVTIALVFISASFIIVELLPMLFPAPMDHETVLQSPTTAL